jgi:hypothetical protein
MLHLLKEGRRIQQSSEKGDRRFACPTPPRAYNRTLLTSEKMPNLAGNALEMRRNRRAVCLVIPCRQEAFGKGRLKHVGDTTFLFSHIKQLMHVHVLRVESRTQVRIEETGHNGERVGQDEKGVIVVEDDVKQPKSGGKRKKAAVEDEPGVVIPSNIKWVREDELEVPTLSPSTRGLYKGKKHWASIFGYVFGVFEVGWLALWRLDLSFELRMLHGVSGIPHGPSTSPQLLLSCMTS